MSTYELRNPVWCAQDPLNRPEVRRVGDGAGACFVIQYLPARHSAIHISHWQCKQRFARPGNVLFDSRGAISEFVCEIDLAQQRGRHSSCLKEHSSFTANFILDGRQLAVMFGATSLYRAELIVIMCLPWYPHPKPMRRSLCAHYTSFKQYHPIPTPSSC